MTGTIVAIAVLATAAGAALGSFAGVVASRGWPAALRGRSHCDGCRRELAWYENVPLASYPLLHGRCRTCGVAIGGRVYAWEVGGAVLGLAAGVTVALLVVR